MVCRAVNCTSSREDLLRVLKALESWVYGALLIPWILLIQPCLDFSGKKTPGWWPKDVPFLHPKGLSDNERLRFLHSLLCGELLMVATSKELSDATKSVWETMNPASQNYRHLVIVINDFDYRRAVFFVKKIRQHGIPDDPASNRMDLSVTSRFATYWNKTSFMQRYTSQCSNIELIFDLNPHFSMLEVDTSGSFDLAWCVYSEESVRKIRWTSAEVKMQNGHPIAIKGTEIPSVLQDPVVVKHMHEDTRAGGLIFVIARSPQNKSVYLAFSLNNPEQCCIPIWAEKSIPLIIEKHQTQLNRSMALSIE